MSPHSSVPPTESASSAQARAARSGRSSLTAMLQPPIVAARRSIGRTAASRRRVIGRARPSTALGSARLRMRDDTGAIIGGARRGAGSSGPAVRSMTPDARTRSIPVPRFAAGRRSGTASLSRPDRPRFGTICGACGPADPRHGPASSPVPRLRAASMSGMIHISMTRLSRLAVPRADRSSCGAGARSPSSRSAGGSVGPGARSFAAPSAADGGRPAEARASSNTRRSKTAASAHSSSATSGEPSAAGKKGRAPEGRDGPPVSAPSTSRPCSTRRSSPPPLRRRRKESEREVGRQWPREVCGRAWRARSSSSSRRSAAAAAELRSRRRDAR